MLGGDEFFNGEKDKNNGLRAVLENRSIVKLIHDCKNDWDSLLYQFNTRIFNFVDTQEAYFIFDLFTNATIGLPIGLSKFIEIFTNKEMKHKSEIKEEMSKNIGIWAQRPLPENLIVYAAEDVIFLIDAFNILNKKLNKNLLNIV